jgi:Lambda phage tail tube protein, TTP
MANLTDTYYAGEAVTGYGAQLLVGQNDGPPETFVAVADVNTITPGDMTTETVDKTHLRSPDAHREKRATIRDSGPFALEGNWRPTHGSQSNAGGDGFATGGLVALWRTRAERNFKIQVPLGEGATIALTGIVQTGGVATATSSAAHGLASGDIVTVYGAAPSAYNGSHVATVLTTTTFTFPVAAGTASPATGTMTAVPTESLEWPFRGVVTKFQPGALNVDDKVGFSAEITPLQDFSADLP